MTLLRFPTTSIKEFRLMNEGLVLVHPTSILNAPKAVHSLYVRMNDNSFIQNKLESFWETTHNEPYSHGNVNSPIWSRYDGHYESYPFPMPRRTSIKSIDGVLGKNHSHGGNEPLGYLDKKYQISYNIIKEHKNKHLTINTSTDLIAHDEYIEALDKENHIINIHYVTCKDNCGKLLEAGAPSFKRRLRAYDKLSRLGYNVNLIHINFDNVVNKFDGLNNKYDMEHESNNISLCYEERQKLEKCFGLKVRAS